MGNIHLLPEQLVNQIAAGEVVERPASVVKELAENALDAGARSIKIDLADGGMSRIQVVDDGCGMSQEDALTCLERHATSKLADESGLKRIATLGFRGEAVPAIASVSRYTLVTREGSSVSATRVVVVGGKIEGHEEIGAPAGTSVTVEDLFFNTPARRKFLKRPETEAGHACDAVVRLALARPDVGFNLVSGGKTVLAAPPDPKDLRERVAAALSSEVFEHLVEVDFQSGSHRLRGHVASPDYSMGTARGIFTFVNGRYVRDRSLIAAVQRAFSDALPPGRQPVAVLFLEVPLEDVDVNVHPQKLEVRFADSRQVFSTVHGGVQAALRRSPWLSKHVLPGGGVAEALESYAGSAPTPLPGTVPSPSLGSSTPVPMAFSFGGSLGEALAAAAPVLAGDEERPEGAQPTGFFHALRVIGQFAKTYIVCEAPGPSLVVIDQHAAHERLKFHQLREAWRTRKAKGQAFLFPASIELPVAEARILAAHLADALALGFEAEPFGGTSFALKAVPAPLLGCDYQRLLLDLASELAEVGKGRAVEQALEDVLATMACHAAVRANQVLSTEEARALLDALDAIDFNTRCPHGRPVAAKVELEELERRVGRR